jgi:hypothetical protein
MIRRILSALAVTAMLATTVAVSAQSAGEDATWEGLQKVKSKRMDAAYLLPGADFRVYDKLMIDPIQVSFRKDWQRDINRGTRSARPRVTSEDADRIRQEMGEGFQEILARDFSKAGYQVVSAPGEDVLRLTPVLVDVYINAPDTMQAGRSRSYTLEAGEATLALEARDAETLQLLGRAVDRRRTGETGTWTWTTSVSNRAEFERMFRAWSSILVDGMAALKDASPIAAPPGK